MKSKTQYIHVIQSIIRSNRKNGATEPALSCKSYNSNVYGSTVIIYDKKGNEAARVVYDPEKKLNCGAVAYVQTNNKVKVL